MMISRDMPPVLLNSFMAENYVVLFAGLGEAVKNLHDDCKEQMLRLSFDLASMVGETDRWKDSSVRRAEFNTMAFHLFQRLTNLNIPRYKDADSVKLMSCDGIEARVMDTHWYPYPLPVQYDVRYFDGGKDVRVRVYEDELEPK